MSIPIKSLSDHLLKEPLTQEAFTIRKNLLLVSCITILCTVYKVEPLVLPWVKLSPRSLDESYNVLFGALSVATFYFLIRFMMTALSDFSRWINTKNLIEFHDFDKVAHEFWNKHNDIKMCLTGKKPNGIVITNPQDLYKVLESAVAWFKSATKEVKKVERDYMTLSLIQWSKLIIIDCSIPILMGVFSLYLTHKDFWPFILVLFNS